MKDRKATALLIAAYGVGQGSTFVLLLITRNYVDATVAGALVLALSIISFAQQFGEIGSNPLLLSKGTDGDMNGVASLLRTRSISGFSILSLFCIWTYSTLTASIATEVKPILLCAPFIALLLGLNYSFLYEIERQYASLALTTIRLWIIISATLALAVIVNDYTYAVLFLLLALLVHILYIENAFSGIKLKAVLFNWKDGPWFGTQIIPIIAAAIAGQIWYRYQILIIADKAGLAQLASLGIIRSMQIAAILATSFAIRPILQRKLVATTIRNTPINLAEMALGFRLPLIALAAISLITILSNTMFTWSSSSLAHWSPLFYGLPIAALAIIANQLNSIQLSPKRLFAFDHIGIFFNIITFFSMMKISLPVAIILGEVIQHLFNIGTRLFIEKNQKK